MHRWIKSAIPDKLQPSSELSKFSKGLNQSCGRRRRHRCRRRRRRQMSSTWSPSSSSSSSSLSTATATFIGDDFDVSIATLVRQITVFRCLCSTWSLQLDSLIVFPHQCLILFFISIIGKNVALLLLYFKSGKDFIVCSSSGNSNHHHSVDNLGILHKCQSCNEG